ncbi:riboflavin synthase subunit alpha [Thermosipho melanesiensis]|uniref:Riboflavin synthase, alpha subunit n=2 Tax=Thermosipho melanesiensis TaxID=46541 RepID=A6LJ22_THEM4|nr:riboflavin synthase [Thermosipho melanesiensis]ABR29923.1 riboflavin synthase, alpha subunit [Thermosipho melanesiensis BI429]APT73131.1 riboflavin synthase subunit alpha [Thermosipho melanesiensis]OOC38529.1 riboflavin synthase subunit alpha [Thermosipho melanesiensis]OOC40333.1 riboflavin synthase subunit alpha [Thermosipho melanesiensis]OOC40597.1 riboflavin synthase subunit alpha [Thermosipho melanesiensis]
MFSGIIEHCTRDFLLRNGELEIKLPFKCEIGDSVSVNGVCLTVKRVYNFWHYFDVGNETMKITNLSFSKYLNIERALKIGDRLNGHFVMGHVDGLIRLVKTVKLFSTVYMYFTLPKERFAIVRKGSIALNGISLTISNVSLDVFEVQVIPHTFENTNLKYLDIGELVNYEIDIFARYGGKKNETIYFD